ncbi:MAG TPA: HPr family phosphocarrier protein [Alphaproteobacteria bacterium]|nr:HPr family phosphocarrier protein [Alphaproteobacteria bacterium]HAJ46272.1 HPr family phosphocarrier protein [Alphaproteobacteria bacterium]
MICNAKGLHARASAKFVQTANRFQAVITVTKDGQRVTGTSIMGLMMLAAGKGCELDITAEGTDAAEAMVAICELIANKFGEGE